MYIHTLRMRQSLDYLSCMYVQTYVHTQDGILFPPSLPTYPPTQSIWYHQSSPLVLFLPPSLPTYLPIAHEGNQEVQEDDGVADAVEDVDQGGQHPKVGGVEWAVVEVAVESREEHEEGVEQRAVAVGR